MAKRGLRPRCAVRPILLSIAVLTLPRPGRAQEATASVSILVIDPAGDDPTATRVAAELRTLGCQVTRVRAPVPDEDAKIQLMARDAASIAAIDIAPESGEIHVWTIDRPTGRLVLRAVILRMNDDPAVAALRAVEALRASVSELDRSASMRPSPPAEVPASYVPPAQPAAFHEPSRIGVSLEPALAIGRNKLRASLEGLIFVHWLVAPHWGLEATGAFPLTGVAVSEAEGSGAWTFGFVTAGAHFQPVVSRWSVFDMGAGVGTAFIHGKGTPQGGFFGSSVNTVVALPYARVGYGLRLGSWVRLRADLASAFAVPRPVLTFAGRAVASWGDPLILASIGIEALLQ